MRWKTGLDGHPIYYDDDGRLIEDAQPEADESAWTATQRGESMRATERNASRYERNAQSTLDGLRRQRERRQQDFEDFCQREGRRQS